MEEKQRLTGFCPHCANKLQYEPSAVAVTCYACDSTIPISAIRTGEISRPAEQSKSTQSNISVMIQGIETPESAAAYVKNYYEHYNWALFKKSSDLFVEEIEELVEEKKIKHGASSAAWLLSFNSKIVPLMHKLDGLIELEKELESVYDGLDYAQAYEVFDLYSYIMNKLYNNGDKIFEDLENDLKFAKEYKAGAAELKEAQTQLEKFKDKIVATVHEVKDIKDEPVIKKIREKLDKEIIEKLEKEGIDVIETYNKAVNCFHLDDWDSAISLFNKIKGYSDTYEYIEKLSINFMVNNTIIKIGKKDFYIKKSVPSDYTFDVKHPEKEVEVKKNTTAKNGCSQESTPVLTKPSVYKGEAYSLYSLKDGEISAKPIIAGITQIIKSYAGKLFFIKEEKDIYCLNTNNNTIKALLKGKPGDFSVNIAGKSSDSNVFYFNKDRNGIFFRKKIEIKKEKAEEKPVEKEGCFKTLFKSEEEIKPEVKATKKQKNNFSIEFLSLIDGSITTLLPEVIDIIEYKNFEKNAKNTLSGSIVDYGDVLFYSVSEETFNEYTNQFSDVETIYAFNINTRRKITTIEKDCEINNVTDEYIIYSQFIPNDYNKNLYVFNINTKVATLIEKNIFDFVHNTNNKVFYTVGNENHKPLFSNNFQGTERKEILKRMVEILFIQAGWMYVIKGSGYNAALVKVSEDGLRSVTLCTQFKRIVKSMPDAVYYVDTDADLCYVRADGTNYKILCHSVVPANVYIGKNDIFLFRYETVDDEKKAFSLYKMDLDGNNVEKLVFNVFCGATYDDKYVYIGKKETNIWKVKNVAVTGEIVEKLESLEKVSYLVLNKETGEFKVVYETPNPKDKTTKITVDKPGCFGKTETKEAKTIWELMPANISIKRKNVAEAGAVNKQEEAKSVLVKLQSAQQLAQAKIAQIDPAVAKQKAKQGSMATFAVIALIAVMSLAFIFPVSAWYLGIAVAFFGLYYLTKPYKKEKKKGIIYLAILFLTILFSICCAPIYDLRQAAMIFISLVGFAAFVVLLIFFFINKKKKFIDKKNVNTIIIILTSVCLVIGILFACLSPLGQKNDNPTEYLKSHHQGTLGSSEPYKPNQLTKEENTLTLLYDDNWYLFKPNSNGIYKFELEGVPSDRYIEISDEHFTNLEDKSIAVLSNHGIKINVENNYGGNYRNFGVDNIKLIIRRVGEMKGIAGSQYKNDDTPSLDEGNNKIYASVLNSYFKFTPDSTSRYTFAINSANYRKEMALFEGNNSLVARSGYSPSITYNLTRGNTYYLEISSSAGEDEVELAISKYIISGIQGISSKSTSAPELKVGNNTIYTNESYSYFKFTPDSTSRYTFAINSANYSKSLYLYNSSSSSYLNYDSGYSPSITYNLTRGNTYYLEISSSAEEDEVTLNITQTSSSSSSTLVGSNSKSTSAPAVYTGSTSIAVTSNASYFKFTPTSSRTYTFSTSSTEDTVGSLYTSSSSTSVAHDDDSGSSSNFSFTYSCNAGTTYYISVKLYSTGSATVTLNIS